uniref:PROTEIN (CRICKET PARALYSIS VIRUS, VP1) n=1 Tax=Cricket paralysis virus TaxID=12136 RepID=UPI0000110743|nr:Chain A, PROTEIN (CRICKET PARALYSIS VIRUS, VP1) [Cricket paralysis virus]
VMGEDQQIPRNEAQHGVHPISIDTHRISNNWSPQAMCIGEKVVSIRQLIKRFGIFGDANTLQADGSSFVVAPFTVTSPTKTLTSTRNYTQFDYYYYLYAFWRGSMRIKMVAETQDGTGTPRKKTNFTWFVRMFNSLQDSFNSLISTSSSAVTTTVLPSGTINMGPSTQVIDPTVEGLIEVEVPYYNISHITPAVTIDDGTPSMEDYLKGHSPPCLLTFSPRDSISATNHIITASFMRALGDDFSFMYLLGVPPLVNVARA